jgi:hypothetical protein
VAKLLAFKTLGEGGLGFVCLYLDADVAEAGEFEYFLEFPVLGKVTRDKVMGFEPSERAEEICLTVTTSKPRSTSPSDMSYAGVLLFRWRNTAFIRFVRFGEGGKIRKGISGKIGLHCLVAHHVLGDYPGPVPGAAEPELLLGHAFQLLLQPDEV